MSSFNVEEEHGTYTGHIHSHNSYYAGDFSGVPMITQKQLAELTALRSPIFKSTPR